MHSNRSRIKGFLTYLAAVIAVVCVHAYALHNDTAAEQDRAADRPAKNA